MIVLLKLGAHMMISDVTTSMRPVSNQHVLMQQNEGSTKRPDNGTTTHGTHLNARLLMTMMIGTDVR